MSNPVISINQIGDPTTRAFISHLMAENCELKRQLKSNEENLSATKAELNDRIDIFATRLDELESKILTDQPTDQPTDQSTDQTVDQPATSSSKSKAKLMVFNLKITTAEDDSQIIFGTKNRSVNKVLTSLVNSNDLNDAVLFVVKHCFSKEEQKNGLSEIDRDEVVELVMKLRNKFVKRKNGEAVDGITEANYKDVRSKLKKCLSNRKATVNRDWKSNQNNDQNTQNNQSTSSSQMTISSQSSSASQFFEASPLSQV